ncbi:chaperonin 10-like protein [Diplogelasinospora grovesii]|uniref:alcohol dehydrogenase (NADP(+)) n=1 Tax=Diplogelasinospora grovesii TaxID=303347 RepID=A0AAN6NGT0_9PEZI|nr:chaperonin 10-like protein [Diplogelasinospora grovesii]
MAAQAGLKFQGWLGKGPESTDGQMEWGEFEPKKWTEDDVDIEISHCGICGTDLQMLGNGWEHTPYPCVVGHEIVGKAVRVGTNVSHIQVGDRVGVGAQARSCGGGSCPECSAGLEQYCDRGSVDTAGSVYPDGEGKSYGGYADYNRTNGRFVVKIPDGLDSALAAPMLCGGITVYAPLREHGCGPGKTVGIVGVGGLGHLGILLAKALGADRVVGISRKADKRGDVLGLGADEYIATDDDQDRDWATRHHRSLDIIVCTVSSAKMPLSDYLELLKVKGNFILVGAPDGGELPPISAYSLILNGINVAGSTIGSPTDIQQLLHLAADKEIKPWIQERPLEDANSAVMDMKEGKARFRYVLVNGNFGKH